MHLPLQSIFGHDELVLFCDEAILLGHQLCCDCEIVVTGYRRHVHVHDELLELMFESTECRAVGGYVIVWASFGVESHCGEE